MAGVIVGIGAYGQRYRHHPFTRFIFLGATTLFLPVISSLVSLSAGENTFTDLNTAASWFATCTPEWHSFLVIIWAFLVHIVMINTSIVVSVDDREGRNVGPPLQLIAQGVWILYLGIIYLVNNAGRQAELISLEVIPFVLISAKILFKYYAFEKARKSFALGKNPRLIFRYMQQLSHNKQSQHHSEEPTVSEDAHAPPPLLVMGEEKRRMDKHPHGYMFKNPVLQQSIGLVTIDRVWQSDGKLLVPIPQRLKDLCLSFALFKLLRCRFARYEHHNIGSGDTIDFFWSFLLKDGEFDSDSVFRVLADELSFVHDYYYSSLPISYSSYWLPIVGIFISFLSIGYCILLAVWIQSNNLLQNIPQFVCSIRCVNNLYHGYGDSYWYGNLYYDLVPMLLIIVVVVTAEARDLLSYACSNWTKVVLVCRLLNSASLQRSLCMQQWFARLFRCRCNLMKHWSGKMGQCSLLVLSPRTTVLVRLRRLLHLPDQKTKIKVPSAVKASIVDALRRSRNGQLSNGKVSLRRWSEVGETFLWACNSNSASNVILTWHIATSILEVRNPCKHDQQQSSPISDHKIAATHISRYCTYLVTWCPELLPDDVAWSKSMYEAIKKDAEHALTKHSATGSSVSEYEYHQLVELLSSNSNHEVVKNGVKLAQQVVEAIDDEQTAWELLAGFWSEMILYVAPSDNLKGHSEAIARGGELITLLWALLNHARIVSRPTDAASAGTDDDLPSDGTSSPPAATY
ncbi:unnamed protein product [Miscanthus lutarioriparius]|uniref:DUF4220 domain-containing protein n=1 Tax=Miscanthus lutarioriparius TaxID=422564 RepID=A0A811REQ2_9POAL|nr:unnamed protein product [Miscanthus lutarioriparius]